MKLIDLVPLILPAFPDVARKHFPDQAPAWEVLIERDRILIRFVDGDKFLLVRLDELDGEDYREKIKSRLDAAFAVKSSEFVP